MIDTFILPMLGSMMSNVSPVLVGKDSKGKMKYNYSQSKPSRGEENPWLCPSAVDAKKNRRRVEHKYCSQAYLVQERRRERWEIGKKPPLTLILETELAGEIEGNQRTVDDILGMSYL